MQETYVPLGADLGLWTRDGTSDPSVVNAAFMDDEYRFAGRNLNGWAIDAGAHIGAFSALLLALNSGLRVVAIEPVPDNVRMLRKNLEPFGDRAIVLQAATAATDGLTTRVWWNYTHHEGQTDEYTRTERFIGNVWREDPAGGEYVEVPTVSLAGVMARYGANSVALVKTDTEGAEYDFLSNPMANACCDVILGEWHDDPTFGERIRRLLSPTHKEKRFQPEAEGITGLFEFAR